ncbi:tRNA uridine-5-carboxymethylaminomethyl(34) synthesis GTPase MnmE [candidate division KSB1 bacterium]|nr:tRNA uridine-5-carboxymethylaminomethyl(34) synthesis GTPase MnmE [candidate division KSB1 bacterium]
MSFFTDTIAAISTPSGEGGIAVVRVSGPQTLELIQKLFLHKGWFGGDESHIARVGYFLDKPGGERIDQVVVTLFREPNSYTGENLIEIGCHGGQYLAGLILETILHEGACLAEPGEFTKRAFVNGRMDLAQAESVADLIHAKTRQSVRYAMRQLQGGFSDQVKGIQNNILELLANLELELDFSEEDIVILPKQQVVNQVDKLIEKLNALLGTYQRGRMIHEGIRTIIVGKPNVGKSSLFNALLGFERAIVDPTPGTTRDALEAQLDIGGALFRLIDTAGIQNSDEKIEKKGIEITESHLRDADLILFILDLTTGFKEEDQVILNKIQKIVTEKTKEFTPGVIVLWNKSDIVTDDSHENVFPEWKTIIISAVSNKGLLNLHEALANYLIPSNGKQEERQDELITNLRHRNALQGTVQNLERAKVNVENGIGNEFIAVDVRESLDSIGEIIGKKTPEDILHFIFDNFCIGK